jgi:SET domain
MTYTNWFYVEEFDLHGDEKGIKARTSIPAGQTIGIYDGELQEFPLVNGKLEENDQHKFIVQVAMEGDRLYGLVTQTRDGVDYINHSCSPNIVPRDRIILVASRDIEPGEILSMDYTKWDFVPEGIKCWCADSRCVI